MRHLEHMNKIIARDGYHGWLRVRDGVLHRLVQRQPLRAVRASRTASLGPYAWAYWTMITCNVIFPQLFWFKKVRTSIPVMFVICDPRQHRHVVRALRHHRDRAPPRLPPVELELLPPDDLVDISTFFGHVRPLLHAASCSSSATCPMVAISEVKGSRRRPILTARTATTRLIDAA